MSLGSKPRVLGADVLAADSDVLSGLSVDGMTIGTRAWNSEVGAFFKLTKSLEDPVADQILLVNGIMDARWILDESGGGNWLNSYAQYVSPSGNDINDGTSWATPKRTMYAATARLLTIGGGTVFFSWGSEFGGPVAGQGLWLRGDSVEVPGFLQMGNHALRFVGVGGPGNQYVFEPAGPVWATSNNEATTHKDMLHPDIWVVGSEIPIEFQFWKSFEPFNNWLGVYAPARIGWDYVRGTNFGIEWLPVTSATRTALSGHYDQTTYTLDMSGAHAWVIISASRTLINGTWTVTAQMSRPATISAGPWTTGSPLHFVSTDVNFPSGNYVCTFYDDVLTPGPTRTTVTVRWVDGLTSSASGTTIGTVQSHGASPGVGGSEGDKISSLFTNPKFQSACMYTVTAATWNTITVNDPYGYLGGGTPATDTNIGTVVKQIRGKLVASAVTWNQCSIAGHLSAGDSPSAGPAVDLGGTGASYMRSFRSYFTGGANFDFTGLTEFQIDYDRTLVAILGHTGAGSTNSNSIIAYDNQSQSGGLRWHGAPNGGELSVDQWLADFTIATVPVVSVVNPGAFSGGTIDHITLADGTAGVATVKIDDNHDGRAWKIGTVLGTVEALNVIGPVVPDRLYGGNATASPWETASQTFWKGGVSAKHPGAGRAMGVTAARYANLWPDVSTWNSHSTAGIVLSSCAAPDGSNTGVLITNGSGSEQCVCGPEPFAIPGLANGDNLIFGAWMNLGGTVYGNKPLQIYLPDGTVVLNNDLSLFPIVGADGWQWVSNVAKVLDAGNASVGRWIDVPANGGHLSVWGVTFLRVPAAVSPLDVYEMAGALKHQPYYLAAGMSGTMEGGKLIAHGGMGISATVPKVAGVGSGQLTVGAIATYEPRYADDGVTIIGWAPLYAATVNP